jgi:hypothetical protein
MQQLYQICFSRGKIIQLSDDIFRKDNCTGCVGHNQRKAKRKINQAQKNSINLFSPLCFILWKVVHVSFSYLLLFILALCRASRLLLA